MTIISKYPRTLLAVALLAGTTSGNMAAQAQDAADTALPVTVTDTSADESAMTEGPLLEGIIAGRSDDKMRVRAADGTDAIVAIGESTKIRASGGFLGLNRSKLGADSLLNGLPVTVRTLRSGSALVASQIDVRNKDVRTVAMIHNGTAQGFADQSAATQSLRGRMADLGQYNIKSTTNVNFDTGKAVLSTQAQQDLCAAATSAQSMNNALLLVVGYADSTGNPEFNQTLSEKRASRVVNYLQQVCGWKPYRMLTPSGMSEAEPLAGNDTPEGRAQNRRVAVNVLISKGLDGL